MAARLEISGPLHERTLPTAGGGLQRRNCGRKSEEQVGTKISIHTGKVSRAFIVRRIVLGCLSRDGGARRGIRCAMVEGGGEGAGGAGGMGGKGREREGEKGGRERAKSAGWKTRTGRGFRGY